MADIFNEIMVRKRITPMRWAFDILLVFTGVNLGILSMIYLGILAAVAVPLLIFIVPWLVKTRYVEFEYVLTNDQLDIDRIVGKSRRKQLYSIDVRGIEILAPMIVDYKDDFNKGEFKKSVDCSTDREMPGRWFLIFNDDREGRTRLVFEPNAKMVRNIAALAPRKVKGMDYLEQALADGDML